MSRKRSRFGMVRAIAMAGIAAICANARAEWVVTEVPTPGGWSGQTEASDINDSGVICGIGNYVSEVSSVAFRYDGTTLTELPYLHPSPANYQYANATAINSSGVIAGRAHDARGIDRAVTWDGAAITLIPYPADANTNGDMRSYGMNDAGVVAGYYSSTTTGQPAAFYYDGTTHSLVAALQGVGLGINGAQSYADDVNNHGVICGEAKDSSGEYNVFTYDIASSTVNVLGNMHPTEGCHAAAINEAGHVVGRGRSVPGGTLHAFVHDGAFRIVDESVGVAQWAGGITEAGRIAGHAGTSTTGGRWSWYSNGPGTGSAKSIDVPDWDWVTVDGINNHDVMVGYGESPTAGGDYRAFIIAPPPGDADHDGDVDVSDCQVFVGCLGGPHEGESFVAPSASCLAAFDFAPADGDVDLSDFGAFQCAFTGPDG